MPHLPDSSKPAQGLPQKPNSAPPPLGKLPARLADPWLLQLGAIALSVTVVVGGLAYSYSRQPEPANSTAGMEADLLLAPLTTSTPALRPLQPAPPPRLPAPRSAAPSAPVAQAGCTWTAARPPAQLFSFPTDPTNYGDRQPLDAQNQPVANGVSLIVLHETVAPLPSVLRLFQQMHLDDASQVSYHMLISRNGTLIQTVPPEKRAFGAGNSAFQGEAVQINPTLPGSVNNFAYHISLESPPDGMNNARFHSGYTAQQYRSLAYWTGLIMQLYGIPWQRITTHQAVDLSGTRRDPRSFDWQRFQRELGQQHTLACLPIPRRAG